MAQEPTSRAHVLMLIDSEPVDGADGAVGWLRRLCGAATRSLPASGTGISVMSGERSLGVAASSSASSHQLEELQFTLGEGPCIEAHGSGRPVFAPDLERSGELRWPLYAPAAHAMGARAVFAFPLQLGSARLGVLDVYRDEPGTLSREATAQAITFAEVAFMSLLDGSASNEQVSLDEELEKALEYRSELYQAQGMVMVQLGVDVEEAIVRLRAYAFAHGRTLGQVAHDVVTRRLSLDRDDR